MYLVILSGEKASAIVSKSISLHFSCVGFLTLMLITNSEWVSFSISVLAFHLFSFSRSFIFSIFSGFERSLKVSQIQQSKAFFIISPQESGFL
jgi:hypothetical protein